MFLAGQFSAHTYAVDNRICRSNVLNLREIHIFSVAGFWEQVAQHKFFKKFLLFSFVVFFFNIVCSGLSKKWVLWLFLYLDPYCMYVTLFMSLLIDGLFPSLQR